MAPDMLKLAEHILDSKAGDFDPAGFRDRYEDALQPTKRAVKGSSLDGALRLPK